MSRRSAAQVFKYRHLHIKLNVIDLKNKVNEHIFSNNAFKSIRKHAKQRIHSGIARVLDYYVTRLLLRQNLNCVIVFLYSVKKILYLQLLYFVSLIGLNLLKVHMKPICVNKAAISHRFKHTTLLNTSHDFLICKHLVILQNSSVVEIHCCQVLIEK